MNIPRNGREYASWTVTGAPEGVTLEVSVDGTNWHTLTRSGDTARVLVAGPDATDNPPGTVSLKAGRNKAVIRAVDSPEVIVRDAGAIDV